MPVEAFFFLHYNAAVFCELSLLQGDGGMSEGGREEWGRGRGVGSAVRVERGDGLGEGRLSELETEKK